MRYWSIPGHTQPSVSLEGYAPAAKATIYSYLISELALGWFLVQSLRMLGALFPLPARAFVAWCFNFMFTVQDAFVALFWQTKMSPFTIQVCELWTSSSQHIMIMPVFIYGIVWCCNSDQDRGCTALSADAALENMKLIADTFKVFVPTWFCLCIPWSNHCLLSNP